MNVCDIDTAKSYATEDNLMKALRKIGLDELNPIVVRNRAGRWTAIFGYHLSQHQNAASIAHHGFKVIS